MDGLQKFHSTSPGSGTTSAARARRRSLSMDDFAHLAHRMGPSVSIRGNGDG